MMKQSRQPWEQQEGESAKAFQAFVLYRDMPPHERSQDRVAQALYKLKNPEQAESATSTLKKRNGRLAQWANDFRWTARASAWDQEVDRTRRQANLVEIRKMNERQAEAGLLAQSKAVARLKRMTDQQVNAMTATEIIAFLREGVKIERTARGEPTAIMQADTTATVKVDPDAVYKDVPLDKLVALKEAYDAALASAGDYQTANQAAEG